MDTFNGGGQAASAVASNDPARVVSLILTLLSDEAAGVSDTRPAVAEVVQVGGVCGRRAGFTTQSIARRVGCACSMRVCARAHAWAPPKPHPPPHARTRRASSTAGGTCRSSAWPTTCARWCRSRMKTRTHTCSPASRCAPLCTWGRGAEGGG